MTMIKSEFLFRGKRLDNKKWVCGSLLSFDNGMKAILPSTAKVFFQRGTTTICCNECYDVNPGTVGRYSGLTDNCGRKIFEGDIVSTPHFRFVVSFQEGCFGGIINNGPHRCFSAMMSSIYGIGGEVIGNIFDNPQLM